VNKTIARLFGSAATIVCALTMSVPDTAAAADPWPNQPIKLVVPFPPGGGSDMTARVVGQKLGERLGQTVIIDNRPGAASNIGMEYVTRAPADGYTILFAVPTVAQNPFLYDLKFDPRKDLVPVSRLTEVSFVLLATPKFAPTTLAELLDQAKRNPGKVTCGSAGATPGIGCELLRHLGKVDINVIPYRGNSPAMTDLISGQIDLLFDVVNAAQPQVKSGRVRAIATTGVKRGLPPFPNLPLAKETLPGLELAAWQALMVPAKTPPAILQRLDREIAAVMADPEVIQKLREGGIEPAYAPAAEFGKIFLSDYERYGKIIKDANMKPN
jgi:tripartite-type tricarboxylate transporter receptor subunit TctC